MACLNFHINARNTNRLEPPTSFECSLILCLELYFILITNTYIFNNNDKPKGWSSINVGLDPKNEKNKPKHKVSSISYIKWKELKWDQYWLNRCLSLTKQGSLHYDNTISTLEPQDILGSYYERPLFSTSPLWSTPRNISPFSPIIWTWMVHYRNKIQPYRIRMEYRQWVTCTPSSATSG